MVEVVIVEKHMRSKQQPAAQHSQERDSHLGNAGGGLNGFRGHKIWTGAPVHLPHVSPRIPVDASWRSPYGQAHTLWSLWCSLPMSTFGGKKGKNGWDGENASAGLADRAGWA